MKEILIVYHTPIVEHPMKDAFGAFCTHRAASSGVEVRLVFISHIHGQGLFGGKIRHISNVHPKKIQYKIKNICVGKSQ